MDNELVQAAILGVIQGLTEFLPVSSSGHLEIGKVLLGVDLEADKSMLMTVVVHAATALSTIGIFWRDIVELLRGLFRFEWNEDAKFAAKIVLSMIPAVVVGLSFEKQIEGLFKANMMLVGAMLFVTGALLFLAGRAKNTNKSVSFVSALIIGFSQAIAILPGISRSGATISTSVLLNVDRARAARFSFLMVVPLIFGKVAKDIWDGGIGEQSISAGALAIGFATAFVTGLIACKWMVALVKNCQLWWFSVYCFLVGAICIAYANWP